MNTSKRKFGGMNHVKAVMFRRWILFRRSLRSIIISSILALFFTVLSIIANFLMKNLLKDKVTPITFNSFYHLSEHIYVASDLSILQNVSYNKLIHSLNSTFYKDTGLYPKISEFKNLTQLNEKMYYDAGNHTGPEYVSMGIVANQIIELLDDELTFYPISNTNNINNDNDNNNNNNDALNNSLFSFYNLTGVYNSSWIMSEEMTARVLLMRIVWRSVFGENTDFRYSTTMLLEKVKDLLFGNLAPMLITCGLCSIVPLIISQPIIDVNGEVREYMISCSLKLFPYWAVTFFADLLLWFILVNLAWLIYVAFNITAVMDNLFNCWYACMMAGPSFILFIYCFSFLFSSPEAGTRAMFLFLVLLLILPLVIDIVNNYISPNWIVWFYAMIPHVGIQRTLTEMLPRVNFLKQNFSYYWKDNFYSSKYLIMQLVDIPLYSFILFFIEITRNWMKKKIAMKKYANYNDFFNEAKAKHPITEEAKAMEEAVNSGNSYAVRICHCSRLFFNTSSEPIPAVNDVSLGIKENTIFGFLGANGAGKTTLIKMISSLLPPSKGTIEIKGVDINKISDPELLSICPQFNTHLCDEMSPREHFRLYRYIHQLPFEEAESVANNLIEKLELTSHVDKPVREMSGGNQRKLAVALSFYGPASIVLLDEPTSSLDPVARHHVHDLIMSLRGRKTFMICTHLLSEAESLCDQISIMIKGCIYTTGSPQYLSDKFGTEYRIDVILNRLGDCEEKCSRFFQSKLPNAKLSILRPNVRIYSIPSNTISLSDLFEKMESGLNEDNGIDYYTCSSSSLERVFMEIIHLSESDTVFAATA